jgi:Protein of unknown function (DUF2637)
MAPAQIALPLDRHPTRPEPAPLATRQREVATITDVPLAAEPPTPEIGVAPGIRSVTVFAVVTVALVAAAASYEHMRMLAAAAGEDWRAWLLPLSVDGLVIAASMAMLVRRRAGEAAGPLAWLSLLLGVGASLAANVAAAEPTVQGRLVAAWPPVALLLSYELLMQQIRVRGGPGVQTVRPGAPDPSDGGDPR